VFDPVVGFFLLGLIARLGRSDLRAVVTDIIGPSVKALVDHMQPALQAVAAAAN